MKEKHDEFEEAYEKATIAELKYYRTLESYKQWTDSVFINSELSGIISL